MTHNYIPSLSWTRNNIGYILLYNEFRHVMQRVKRAAKRVKNNQFNIKWNYARMLKRYYTAKDLKTIERRLDVLLFRTNWFINKKGALSCAKSGVIKVNNKIHRATNCPLSLGALVTTAQIEEKKNKYAPSWASSKYLAYKKKQSGRADPYGLHGDALIKYGLHPAHKTLKDGLHYEGRFATLKEWKKKRKKKMAQNASWLEINNNIKSFIVLKEPKFKNIPFPFNLHKFYV